VLDALPLRYCDWWLSLETIMLAIGMPANQHPLITAGVMYTLADLLRVDIYHTLAVWARDDHCSSALKRCYLRNESKQNTTGSS